MGSAASSTASMRPDWSCSVFGRAVANTAPIRKKVLKTFSKCIVDDLNGLLCLELEARQALVMYGYEMYVCGR